MAGDWLKVETITPDKPEVANIAHRLGITAEEAFGRLFRVWVWCQNVSVNGHVRVRDLSPIDRAAQREGFGQAMAEEHWIGKAPDGFVIPKWDRHLSKGAKKRVLDMERKRRERENSVPDASRKKADDKRTRERERGSSSPSEKKGRAPPRTPKCRMPAEFSADFVATDPEIMGWNESKGFDKGHLPLHFEYFKLAVEKTDLMYAGAKGWRAAFKKAVSEDWAGLRKKGKPDEAGQLSWIDRLTSGKGGGDDIEGVAERVD